jgi:hypothetical protein
MKPMVVCTARTLILFLILTAAATSAMSGDHKPFAYRATETIVVSLATGQTNYSGSGQATHAGRFINEGTGQADLTTMAYEAQGTLTAADGDQIFWVGRGILGGSMQVTIKGGTGRFANATGELPSWQVSNEATAQENGYLVLSYDSVAEGWISY